jgi:hypothetical protein
LYFCWISKEHKIFARKQFKNVIEEKKLRFFYKNHLFQESKKRTIWDQWPGSPVIWLKPIIFPRKIRFFTHLSLCDLNWTFKYVWKWPNFAWWYSSNLKFYAHAGSTQISQFQVAAKKAIFTKKKKYDTLMLGYSKIPKSIFKL